MEHWKEVELAGLSSLAEKTIVEVSAGGRRVCLLKIGGRLYAFSPHCPHAGARLCAGWVNAQGDVVCPAHGYRFSPKNGLNRSGEGYRLKTFPVKVEDDRIFVLLPQA